MIIRPGNCHFLLLPGGLLLAVGLACQPARVNAQGSGLPDQARCVVIELFVTDGQPESEQARLAAAQIAESRAGIRLVTRPVNESEKARDRLSRIAEYYKFDKTSTPVIYGCDRVIRSGTDAEDFQRQLRNNLKIEVFTRVGCSRCAAAKRYLPGLARQFPGFEIVYRDITNDSAAMSDLNQLVRQYRKAATSTPVFHFCNQMIIGFDRAESTGARIEQVLDRWCKACPPPEPQFPGDSDISGIRQSAAREVAASGPFGHPGFR